MKVKTAFNSVVISSLLRLLITFFYSNQRMEVENLNKELVEQFIQLHLNQLQSSGVPEIYWPGLFSKLKDEVFDAGSYFQIVQRVDEDDNVIGYKALCINELDTNDPIGYFIYIRSYY